MKNQITKEYLQEQIATLRRKLSNIEHKEAAEITRAYLKNCYAVRNCYSCPTKKSDYWTLYKKVTRVSGRWIYYTSFQTDRSGYQSYRPNEMCHYNSME